MKRAFFLVCLALASRVAMAVEAPSQALVDFDGDGRSDVAAVGLSPVEGAPLVWAWRGSLGSTSSLPWGLPSDVPVPGDYDGDGLTDPAVYRPATGQWWLRLSSSNGQAEVRTWGAAGHRPVPRDYDGDGQTDLATYDPERGDWYVVKGKGGPVYAHHFGDQGDLPAPADYDGDARADFAVFRPRTGFWWILSSEDETTVWSHQFGAVGDLPIPADYDGDRLADLAVFRPLVPGTPNRSRLGIRSSQSGTEQWFDGAEGDRPAPADYDGDGKVDPAFFRPATGETIVFCSDPSVPGCQPRVEPPIDGFVAFDPRSVAELRFWP